jgi:indole-3-glycerol phosphate synthase
MAMSLVGIAAHVAQRVRRLSAETSLDDLAERPLYARVPRAVGLTGAPVYEIRFADPEAGLLLPKEQATPEEAARRAVASRAGTVAVWVERNFHAGDWTHLEAVRAALPDALIIARDYVVDPWQLVRARAAGADGIELVQPVLGPAFLAFAAAAREIGLTPLSWGEDGAPRTVGP